MGYFKVGDLVTFRSAGDGDEVSTAKPWEIIQRRVVERVDSAVVDYELFRLDEDGEADLLSDVAHDVLVYADASREDID